MTSLTTDNSDFVDYQNYRIELGATKKPFCQLLPSGQLEWNFHLGQRRVMESTKRVVAAIAGRQSGKTAILPIWLHEEMRRKGPGLYMVVAPSYPLLMDAAVPKITELFQTYRKLGELRSNPLRFIISKDGARRLFSGTQWANRNDLPETTIRFGHAANPESLEAKTALAACLDEAGQDGFKLSSWEAIQGRLTTTLGRVLICTTPYNLGWLKQKIVDPWEKANRNHPDIDVVNFKSIMNPAFSEEEYYRLKDSMPFWKWDMFYNGNFTVPAGLIYGIMREKEELLKIKRVDLPKQGVWYGGLDFGGPNTCAVMGLRASNGNFYLTRSYYPGYAMPIGEHVRNIRKLSQSSGFDRFIGGAKSEGQFREEFAQNGLMVEEPSITDVQTGIDRVYGLIAQDRLYVCDDLDAWWSELYTYQYESDPDTGDVLPELKIKGKSGFHHMDATRYLCSAINSEYRRNVARAGGERENTELIESTLGKLLGPNQGYGLQEVYQPDRGRVARGGSLRNGAQNEPQGRPSHLRRPSANSLSRPQRKISLDDF